MDLCISSEEDLEVREKFVDSFRKFLGKSSKLFEGLSEKVLKGGKGGFSVSFFEEFFRDGFGSIFLFKNKNEGF